MLKWLKQKRCTHHFVYLGTGQLHLRPTSNDPQVIEGVHILCDHCGVEHTIRPEDWFLLNKKQEVSTGPTDDFKNFDF